MVFPVSGLLPSAGAHALTRGTLSHQVQASIPDSAWIGIDCRFPTMLSVPMGMFPFDVSRKDSMLRVSLSVHVIALLVFHYGNSLHFRSRYRD